MGTIDEAAARVTRDPVSRFLDDVVTWSTRVNDPRADRLAMICGDLQAKAVVVDSAARQLAKTVGYDGSVDRMASHIVAVDVLRRAQAALDKKGAEVDPAVIAAGLGAAKRLLKEQTQVPMDGLRYHIGTMLLGGPDGTGMLAPGTEGGDDE